MTGSQNGSASSTCPACGEDLVLEMDPAAPPDDQAVALLADPPFRYVCASEACRTRQESSLLTPPEGTRTRPGG
jgi:hypothetical protein